MGKLKIELKGGERIFMDLPVISKSKSVSSKTWIVVSKMKVEEVITVEIIFQ